MAPLGPTDLSKSSRSQKYLVLIEGEGSRFGCPERAPIRPDGASCGAGVGAPIRAEPGNVMPNGVLLGLLTQANPGGCQDPLGHVSVLATTRSPSRVLPIVLKRPCLQGKALGTIVRWEAFLDDDGDPRGAGAPRNM